MQEIPTASSTPNYPSIPKPNGRYNNWGERKWIQTTPQRAEEVSRELASLNLSPRAHALYQAAKFTDSKGIEFVFVSNTQFPGPVVFKGDEIHIVPCFIPLQFVHGAISEDRQAAMMRRGRYIYDGWIPISNWSKENIERLVSVLDDIVNFFSIVGRFHAYWEPKDYYEKSPIPSQVIIPDEFAALSKTLATVESLTQADKIAITRSVAWIANASRDDSPVQRFLLLFVSIEALATYIERQSEKDSPLRSFAADMIGKEERKHQREACIQELLGKEQDLRFSGNCRGDNYIWRKFCDFWQNRLPYLADITATPNEPDLTEAVKKAYFECVVGSRKLLEGHLNRVFGNSQASKVVFYDSEDGKSLWDLRNDIAHGSLNLLSEKEIRFLSIQLSTLENIARDYLRLVLSSLAQVNYFSKPRRPILTFPLHRAIGMTDTQFTGPTDMAEYYADVDLLASSHIRVVF